MAALNRAFALSEREHVSVSVCKQLDLDVPWPLHVALAEDAIVAEGSLRLASRGLDRVVQVRALPARRAYRGRRRPLRP